MTDDRDSVAAGPRADSLPRPVTSTTPTPPTLDPVLPPPVVERRTLRQRFRDRMQRFARSRYALAGMFGLSFTDACVSPIIPEVLLVPMCLANREKRYVYAFWASVASVLGGIAGYFLGYFLWESGLREWLYANVPVFTPEMFTKVSTWYGANAFVWVWLAGFTPLPYKVFTVLAGVCHEDVDFFVFVLASATSRAPRFYGTVWLLDRFGPPVLDFVMKRLGAAFLVVLLIALGIVLWVQLG